MFHRFYSKSVYLYIVFSIIVLECLGNFELILHKGYFKNGYIDKGDMASHGDCACACNEAIDCVAIGLREDSQKCFFYVDVSDLNENVADPKANIYAKNSLGNLSSLL